MMSARKYRMNGVGYTAWENVFGQLNQLTERDAEVRAQAGPQRLFRQRARHAAQVIGRVPFATAEQTGHVVEAAAAAKELTGEALASHKTYWRSAGLLLQVSGGFFGMFLLAKLALAQDQSAKAITILQRALEQYPRVPGLHATSIMYKELDRGANVHS